MFKINTINKIVFLFLMISFLFPIPTSVRAINFDRCISGSISTIHEANECKKTIQQAINEVQNFQLKLATFLIIVESDNNFRSHGSGFLISREKGYVVTAKHVILGDKVWDIDKSFTDFESAMEDFFVKNNVQIKLRPYSLQHSQTIEAKIVSFSRSTDLVLLQIENFKGQWWAGETILQSISFAWYDCQDNMKIKALGWIETQPGNFELRWSNEGIVTDCFMRPQTARFAGRKFRYPLHAADKIFLPGMSGGPVFNEHKKVVGIVAGGTVSGESSYFVPASAVKSFLEGFGAHFQQLK